MGAKKLSATVLLTIEAEITKKVDLEYAIDYFITKKEEKTTD